MSFQFKSSDNTVASPVWEMLFTPSQASSVTQSLMKVLGTNNAEEVKAFSKDAKIMMEALEAIQRLPQKNVKECADNWRYRYHNKIQDNDKVFVLGAAQTFNAELKLGSNQDIDENEFKKSWDDLTVIRLGLKRLHNMGSLGKFLGSASSTAERCERLRKRVEKNNVTFEEVADPLTQKFIQSEGVALFVSQKHWRTKEVVEGFLGAKDDLVPLMRARLFDSEEAARSFVRRTNVKHRFENFQVVQVNVQTQGLGGTIEGNSKNVPDNASLIHEVVAKIQKDQIEQALKNVGRERLLAQLEELDRQENNPPETPSPKRKM